jgi:ribosomal protein S18 acetylase RimI-like enzyme
MKGTLEQFTPAHCEQALALWRRTPGVGLSAADEPQRLLAFMKRNPGLSFVVEVDGVVAGTILCGHDGRRGLIHHLVVDMQHRRAGIGSRLLSAALGGLRAEGIDKAHLLVFRDNAEGLAFWRARAVARDEMALFSVSVG